MATIKPNEFPNSNLPLTGVEELYTQTNGLNGKFTVQDILNLLKYTLISTGVPIPSYFIDFGGTEYQVHGAKFDFILESNGSNIVHNLDVKHYISIEIIDVNGRHVGHDNQSYYLLGTDPNSIEEVGWDGGYSPTNMGYIIMYYIPN